MSRRKVNKNNILTNNSLSKVFIIKNDNVANFRLQKIKLPRKTSLFLIPEDKSAISEVLQFNEKHRSWFINNTVCSNGKIYIVSKIDPMFIFIQYLEENCRNKAKPLNQVFLGESEMFLDFFKNEQMTMVADQRGPSDLNAFIYNDEKTWEWLKKKFVLLKKSLKERNIVNNDASSSNYVKSISVEETVDENWISETTLGIISEYVSLQLYEKLERYFDCIKKPEDKIINKGKRKSEIISPDCLPDLKKIKGDTEVPTSLKTKKTGTKEKAFEKAAKGSKSISSFFTKK